VSALCYACGLPLDPNSRVLELGDLTLRFEAQELVCRGKSVRLQPAQCRYIAVMIRNAGFATHHQLLDASGSKGHSKKLVEVQIHHIRKRLLKAKMPVMIQTVRERGYMLEVVD
jgi:DNA-binding response OmpR family regulator